MALSQGRAAYLQGWRWVLPQFGFGRQPNNEIRIDVFRRILVELAARMLEMRFLMRKVSDVSWSVSFIRRLALFQSLRQFISWAFCVIAFYYILILVESVIGVKLFKGWGIFIFPVVFSLYSVYCALPCRFYVFGAPLSEVKSRVDEVVVKSGYIISSSVDGKLSYRSKLPKWLSWSENSVYLIDEEGKICVESPRLIIRRLHSSISSTVSC
ncbi:hypothetical protein [Xanthomonas oryzae]|uniref:hypothetical protein n=1 Tax=Xanthomonas oryzae TaxID=347 RepID=UPI001036DA8D|nr:hypothetical protein [Xanthomonas oryzae]QBI13479.1 hypothetical protein EYR02_17935 [Xanthomonas oryzae pv. oryzae]